MLNIATYYYDNKFKSLDVSSSSLKTKMSSRLSMKAMVDNFGYTVEIIRNKRLK